MIYFAHRGASASAPANTLPAFALARQQGAAHYELDVHLTRDGQLVVHHDYQIGGRLIAQMTAAEVKQYVINAPQDGSFTAEVPLLREVFPVVADDLQLLNIEIKNDDNVYPGIEEAVWEAVQDFVPHSLHKLLFSSFDYPTLYRLRELAPKAQIGLLTRLFEPQQAHNLHAYSVHMNHTRITKEIIDICHRENRRVFLYTVNDRYTAQKLAQLGADGIFTDKPSLFLPR